MSAFKYEDMNCDRICFPLTSSLNWEVRILPSLCINYVCVISVVCAAELQ